MLLILPRWQGLARIGPKTARLAVLPEIL